MDQRELLYKDDKSDKFWTIRIEGCSHTVFYGRTGTQGQRRSKSFASEDEARRSFDKLVKSKLRKGYVDANADKSRDTSPPRPPSIHQSTQPKESKPASSTLPLWQPENQGPPKLQQPSSYQKTLGIEPSDYAWVTWKKPPPAKAYPVRPFDQPACAAKVASMRTCTHGSVDWGTVDLRPGMTKEEALFWLRAIGKDAAPDGHYMKPNSLQEYADQLAADTYPPSEWPGEDQALASTNHGLFSDYRSELPEFTLLLSHFVTRERMVLFLFYKYQEREKHNRHLARIFSLLPGLAPYFVYPMPEETRAVLKEHIHTLLQQNPWPKELYLTPHISWFLAAALGFHDEILSRVESWNHELFCAENLHRGEHLHRWRPLLMVFGLGSVELLKKHYRRLRLEMHDPWHVRAWLAHTGTTALWAVRNSILAKKRVNLAEGLLHPMTHVVSANLAPFMLDMMRNSLAPAMARRWLLEHPVTTTIGLAPLLGQPSADARAALTIMRKLKAQYGPDVLSACKDNLSPDTYAKLHAEVLTHNERSLPLLKTESQWLRDGLAEIDGLPKKARTLPLWLSVERLPNVEVSGCFLSQKQRRYLAIALSQSTAKKTLLLVDALGQHGNQADMEGFVWGIFQEWIMGDTPSKDKWALAALAYGGRDQVVKDLAPYVKRWPGLNQHRRALLGLAVLESISSIAALYELNIISQQSKFKSLKKRALEAMEVVAKKLGMSSEQLADSVVPTGGLNEQGQWVVDYGSRQFRFVLTDNLKAVVRGPHGKQTANPPKPSGTDDPKLAQEAMQRWRGFKKEIQGIASLQVGRLEFAMTTGRRWHPSRWNEHLLQHRLMRHLVARLVWGHWDNGTVATFRCSTDGQLIGLGEKEIALPQTGDIGIVHPLTIPPEMCAAWRLNFEKNGIRQPFLQLDRPTRRLPATNQKLRFMTRYANKDFKYNILNAKLLQLGWIRGHARDHGVTSEHIKPFPSAGITAVLEYEGMPLTKIFKWSKQKIERVFFLKELLYDTAEQYDANKALEWTEVDPVAMSEVLVDLEKLLDM